ncbi:hypothetical protein [Shimia gijangensis]|nr:hypothetical protein [Shimia gijangensis]
MNRQQFNKYLSGSAHPSRRNLMRICTFFEIAADDLDLPHREFLRLSQLRKHPLLLAGKKIDGQYNPDSQSKSDLQRYCGYYHTYQKLPHAKNSVVIGLCRIKQSGSHYLSDYVELLQGDIRKEISQKKSKMHGLVTLEGGFIYILDHKAGNNPSYAMTVLFPSRSPKMEMITGMTLGVSHHLSGSPYAANIVYKKLPDDLNLRQAIRHTGQYASDTVDIAEDILHIISNQIRPDQHVLSHGFL